VPFSISDNYIFKMPLSPHITHKLKANIWKLNLYMLLYSLLFFMPIMVLFYQDNGLSLTQVMLIQSFTSIIFVTLEVPSGYFADHYGRKKALLLTGIFAAIAMLAFALGTNIYHFLGAASLWAVAGVFISGADSSFLYDTLVDLKQEHTYKKVWGNTVFYYSLGAALASLIGGFLGSIDYRYPFLAMIPTMLLLIPLSLSFYEPSHHRTIVKQNYFSGLFVALKSIIIHKPKLRWLMLFAAIVTGFKTSAYFLYQPYFELSGLNITYFGLVFAAFNIVAAIGSKNAHYIEKYLGQKKSLALIFLLLALAYVLMGSFIFMFSFLFAFLIQFQKGIAKVIISDNIHQLTDSRHRATTLSVQSLIGRVFLSIMGPFIGYLVDALSLPQALMYSGIMVVILGGFTLGMFFLSKKKTPR